MNKPAETMPLRRRLLANHAFTLGMGLGLVAAIACRYAQAREDGARSAAIDLNVGAAEYPDDDAIILRWEQRWSVGRDGFVRRRDHKWIKLLNRRPTRAFADPKLDFCENEDEIVIHTAQTILPDGTVLPVPEYSFNIGAAGDVAGWPAYADWKQRIISFSGVQPGATLELDYEVRTKGGVLPWVSADMRLDDDYPIVERIISVTLPRQGSLLHQLDRGASSANVTYSLESSTTTQTHTWSCGPLAGAPGEPQSLRWERRCPRLRWTTVASSKDWVAAPLEGVRSAAGVDEKLRAFARAAIEEETDVVEQIRNISRKIHDRFNYLDSFKTYRALRCRAAADVLRANYGNPLEAAALYLAAFRSLGLKADVELAVDADTWSEEVPTESAFAGLVVVADTADGPVYVHPQHGVFTNPGDWGRHRLVALDSAGALRTTDIRARGEQTPSVFEVAGKIVVAQNGSAAGELRLRLTGAFYDPLELETADDQQAFINGVAARILCNVKAESYSINALSTKTFRAVVSVASDDALPASGHYHVLSLGEGPAFLKDFPLPLDRSYRRTDVQLAGRFRESVNVTVQLPDGWAAPVVPAALPRVAGAWGAVEQSVEARDQQTFQVRRTVALTAETIPADDFAVIRNAVNDLRADGSIRFLLGPQ